MATTQAVRSTFTASPPRGASPARVRARRSIHDHVARWLALGSLVLVTFIVVLIVFS